jgi:hypothetical protein
MKDVIKSKVLDIYIQSHRGALNFDEACNSARRQALMLLEISDDGHCHKFPEFKRSESSIKVGFIGLEMTGGMTGWSHYYHFQTWVEKQKDSISCGACGDGSEVCTVCGCE